MTTTLQFDAERARRLERAYSTADIRAQREETLRQLSLQPGEAVIDIGCGPGFLCERMAELVGQAGSVLGIDVSQDLIDLAGQRNPHAWLTYAKGDAAALDVPDESLDAAVCTQVLEYVPDADRALREMHRVLRPGGRVLIVDTDWDGVVWHTADRARMAKVMRAWEAHCADPRLPRTLMPRLAAAGFRLDGVSGWSIVNTSLHEQNYSRGILGLIEEFVGRANAVAKDELAAWAAEQRALSDAGAYFFATTRLFFRATKARG
jgi:ubiquinone/menaquinone biosynthesis C-methylase UbiE